MIILKAQRILLRPLSTVDLVAFVAYRSDPEVARYQSWTTPYTSDQAAALLKGMNQVPAGTPGIWFQLAIERFDQPGIIGDCAFQILSDDSLQAHIGFTLSRQFQKQGYGAEAVRCLLGYLFGELQLHRVTAICDAENLASARLLESVGMRREGHYLSNIWFKGAWGSEFSYALLEKEWHTENCGN